MKKTIFYFIQSIIIYLFFLISKIIGLKLSRKFFSFIFVKIGRLFKSKKIILQNLDKIYPKASVLEKELIINRMWSNYGKTFIEYIYLNTFRKNQIILILKTRKLLKI